MMAAMASRKKSLYDILGVPRDASAADIDAAYERRKSELDGTGSPDMSEMALLRDARDALKNPARRSAYDATLASADAAEAAEASEAQKVQARVQAMQAQAAASAGNLRNTAGASAVHAGSNASGAALSSGRRAAPSTASSATASPEVDIVEPPPQRSVPWVPIGIGLVVLLVLVVAMTRTGPKPETPDKHTEAAPGTMVAPPPPPPAKRSGAEIIADASTSGGQVLSYSMSGQAIPIGLAVSTEPGFMVTTCHGIPAGAKLVVRVQETSYPADLVLTDEVLDLCRLQVANFTTRPLRVASTDPKAGDAIFAVGADQAGKFAATSGTVKNILDTADGKLVELSMPVGQFSSGGGVFNDVGELVGIEMFQHRSGLSIAYPVSWLAQMKSRQQPAAIAPAAPAAADAPAK